MSRQINVAEGGNSPKIDKIMQSDRIASIESQDNLKCFMAATSHTEEHQWLVTPEQLSEHQSAAELLYFPAPNILDKTTDGLDTLHNLYQQFGNFEG